MQTTAIHYQVVVHGSPWARVALWAVVPSVAGRICGGAELRTTDIGAAQARANELNGAT